MRMQLRQPRFDCNRKKGVTSMTAQKAEVWPLFALYHFDKIPCKKLFCAAYFRYRINRLEKAPKIVF